MAHEQRRLRRNAVELKTTRDGRTLPIQLNEVDAANPLPGCRVFYLRPEKFEQFLKRVRGAAIRIHTGAGVSSKMNMRIGESGRHQATAKIPDVFVFCRSDERSRSYLNDSVINDAQGFRARIPRIAGPYGSRHDT